MSAAETKVQSVRDALIDILFENNVPAETMAVFRLVLHTATLRAVAVRLGRKEPAVRRQAVNISIPSLLTGLAARWQAERKGAEDGAAET